VDSAPVVGPLQGVRVLDLTRFPPGAYCTLLLADLGAEVTRLEPPPAAGRRATGAGFGLVRGKRSVTLDQRHPRGNEVLRRLAGAADVLVENSVPGQMDERGFGYQHAAVEFPRLIWCSISGYGQVGPYATRSGHDLTYTAHSGLLTALSPELPWHPQAMISVPLGAMMAAMGIASALVARDRTGKGCQIDVSLADACTWLLSGDVDELTGTAAHIGVSPGRRLYECGDGRYITVAAAEPRTWEALCEALGLPDLMENVYPTGEDAEAITKRLSSVFATRPADEWVDLLGPIGAAVGSVNRGADIVADPHGRARGTTVEIDGVAVPANPIRLRDMDGPLSSTANTAPPEPGEHTDVTLAAAGFSADEIADLRSSGAV
jgi:crotonobetainyl-CoA:carnitine CoA-transferase CaiB-like acyl-CoA transferase